MKVFITGMTGTLGTAIAAHHRTLGHAVYGCARSEVAAVAWLRDNDSILRVRDAVHLDRLLRISPGIDRVYHCAAVKHIDMCEVNIADAVQQNIDLVDEVSMVCRDWQIPWVHVSTDKAFAPTSVYGATKLIAERIALQRGAAVVRFGNLIGSSGSVFKLWAAGQRKLTDPNMTRFFLPVYGAAEFCVHACPGLTYPTMKAVRMGDVATRLGGGFECIGLRPGETLHQFIDEGVSSEHAERWDIDGLLQEAGL